MNTLTVTHFKQRIDQSVSADAGGSLAIVIDSCYWFPLHCTKESLKLRPAVHRSVSHDFE